MNKKIIGIIVCTLLITASTFFVINAVADWDPSDGHKMHWAQTPDLSNTGMDVDLWWSNLADDWECSETGPVTDIHMWGSYVSDVEPFGGPGAMTFTLKIHANIPEQPFQWSMPGATLWSKTFQPGQYTFRNVDNGVLQDWWDPVTQFYIKDNHLKVFQFNFKINENEAFTQVKDTIYWLEVQKMQGNQVPQPPNGCTFGWKTTSSSLRWGDAAVYDDLTGNGWRMLWYPQGHELFNTWFDLAFVITGNIEEKLDFGDAPTPYPTPLALNGARHSINQSVFLGKVIDNENDGTPSLDSLFDDNNPILKPDDEDGIIFTKLVHPGKQATVKVTASIAGKLDAWVDFKKNNQWTDPNENIFISKAINAGSNYLTFNIPAATPICTTYSRFRFSTAGGLGVTGKAPDGEVEDYRVFVVNEINNSKMHYPQLPDLDDTGIDLDMFVTPYADDFKCNLTGPITNISFWGAFWSDQLPKNGVGSLIFKVCIFDNKPADQLLNYSRPGKDLWNFTFAPGSYTCTQVGDNNPGDWYDGVTWFNDNHLNVYQYNFKINKTWAFYQKNGTIYWLYIKNVLPENPAPDFTFGWKTAEFGLRWQDDAVGIAAATGNWTPLKYPKNHKYYNNSLGLAFIIGGEKGNKSEIGNVTPIPPHPWPPTRPGDIVYSSFSFKNIGDPGSLLNWEVETYPSWGTWIFTPSNGTNLKPSDGRVLVNVTVVAPNEKKKDFAGEIKVVNKDNNSNYFIMTIYLSTMKNKEINIFSLLLERLFYRFSFFEKILIQYYN